MKKLFAAALLFGAFRAAGQVPFEIPASLASQGLFSCGDLTLGNGATVYSAGNTTAARAGAKGHVISNGDVILSGRVVVDGNATAGPGRAVSVSPDSKVTGGSGPAARAADCRPIDIRPLLSVYGSTNDNERLPKTAKGKSPLRGDALYLEEFDFLTLPAGTYVVSSITLERRALLKVSGQVRILCTGDIFLTGNSSVNPAGGAFNLRIFSTGANVSLELLSAMGAYLYAPDAVVSLQTESRFVGAIFAASVDLSDSSNVTRVVDDAPPQVTITDPIDGGTVSNFAAVRVRGFVSHPATAVRAVLNGAPLPLAADGSFDAVVDVSAGPAYEVAVTATQALGLVREARARFCTAPPAVALVSPADGSVVTMRVVDLSGTCGSAVSVTAGSTTVPCTNGSFRIPGFDLGGDGDRSIVIRAASACATSTTVAVITVDSQPPFVTIDTPAAGTVFGASPITVSGIVRSLRLRDVRVNGIGAEINGDRFTARNVSIPPGPSTLTAVATDVVGRSSTATADVVFQQGNPVVLITSPPSGTLVGTTTVTVVGTVTGATVSSVTVAGRVATLAGTNFTAAGVPLAEGDNLIAAVATVAGGQTFTSPAVAIVRDTLPPQVTIDTGVLPPVTDQLTVTVTGTAIDPHLASVTVNGVAATLVGTRFSAPNVPLVEGDNALVARGVDSVGNAGDSAPLVVNRDTQAPVIAITSPAPGAKIAATPITVTGTVAEPHLVSVKVGAVTATVTGGQFVATGVTLPEGDVVVTATATDTLGRTGTASNPAVVDTLAPVVTIDPPSPSLVTTPAVTVTGSIQEPHLLSLTVNGVHAVVSGDRWIAVNVPLVEGVQQLRALADDTFSHHGESAPVTYELVSQAPAISIDSPTLAPGACLPAGVPATVSGRVFGSSGAAPTVVLTVRPPVGSARDYAGVLDAAGKTWSVAGVDLGSADGTTSLSVKSTSASGLTATALKTLRVKASVPAVRLLLDGATFPGSAVGAAPGPAEQPVLFGRTLAPRAQVTDSPDAAPPAASLTLDGVAYAESTAIVTEGTHVLVARAVDCAGREGAAHALFTIDVTPPRLLSTSPSDGASLGAAVSSFSGVSDPDLATAKVNGVLAAVSNGTFTLSPFPWREGSNTVAIELTDRAGNRATYTRGFGVKSLGPAVEIVESGLPIPPGVTFFRAVTPVVRSNDPTATVTATLNGAPFTSGTPILASGDYTLAGTATDAFSHQASATATFKIDLTPGPALDISSPADRAVLPGPTVAVSGTASASVVTVTVNGRTAVLASGTWTLPDLALPLDTLSEITAIGTDAAGRTATAVRQVLVHGSGPAILILDPPDGFATNRKKIDVAGAVVGGPGATADGKVVVAGVTLTLDPLGNFRATAVPLADGLNTITASALDAQGRTGLATVHVTSDATIPVIAILADGQPLVDGSTFITPFTLRVAITKPSGTPPVPTIRLNGQQQTATSAVTDIPITQNGGYLVAVVARDAAGNESRAERGFTLSLGGCSLSELDPTDGSAVAAASATIRGRSGDAKAIVIRVPNPGTSPVTYQSFPAPLADGTFALGNVPLPAVGDNMLQIDCTDRGGSLRTTPLKLTRLASGAGPVVHITSPAAGGRQTGATTAVSGTVSDATAAVTLNGLPAAVTAGGTFSIPSLPLAEGPNVLYARAIDLAGREGDDRIVFFRDSAAPKVTITSPVNNAHVGPKGAAAPSVDVTGLVDITTEPNLVSVTVATSSGSVPAAVDFATGAFSAPGVPLSASSPGAPQTITATAADALGQTGTASVAVVFDAAGPALKLAQPADLTRYSETSPTTIGITGEAWAADGAQIAINGGGLDPATLSWEPAAADGRRHTTFSASIGLPATDGAFGVVARVDDPAGKFANDRRTLYRDGTAPTVVDMFPPDGSKTVDPNEILLVLFSEPVLVPSLGTADGLTLTRVSTGDRIAGLFTQAGNAVAFTPATGMVRGESYRFRAGTGVTDFVAHPLAAAKQVTFTIALSPSGTAPTLDPIPPVFCATDLTVTGTAAPGASLRLRDGSLTFSAVADATGRFSVKIPLSGNGFHSLRVAAIDRDSGTSSPEIVALFRVDCSAPTVVGAALDRGTGLVTVTFSEAMSAGTLTVGAPPAAIRVSDAEDTNRAPQAAALSLSSDGTVATLDLGSSAGAWWRTKSVRFEVGPPASDLRGNVMGAKFETVFFLGGGDLSGAFLSGEAYDEESGRPLAGADVKLFASGAALPGSVATGSESAPVASTVTDGRGRFSLVGDLPAGRYALVIARSGYSRVVRRLALEPAVGAVPFDSRLTPLTSVSSTLLNPGAGGSFAGPTGSALVLDVAPAALSGGSLGVALTPLSGQGLPDLLPLGWTPLASAEVRLLLGTDPLPEGTATPFAPGSTKLTLPLPAGLSPTATLYAARYDVSSGLWVSLPVPEILSGPSSALARVTLVGPGTVSVLLPDADPTAPPSLPNGPETPLLGASLPNPIPALTGQIALDPPVVSPTGRAAARVVAKSADNVTPWPSGLAVQAYLDEKLILSGGGELYESPFSTDLVLYHSPLTAGEQGSAAAGAAGAMGFRVSPSPTAAQVLLETGYENIRLYPFPDQIERGSVLGPAGGSVTSPDGTDLFIPEGGLPQKTVVKARLLSPAEMSTVVVPQGFTLVAGVRVDLSGFSLARAATLKINAPSTLPNDAAGDPRLVLAYPVDQPDDGRGAFSRVVGRVGLLPAAGSTPARLVAAPEDSASTLPLAGITVEGVYLYLHASAPIGFATGLVRASNGTGYSGARVTAANLGTADLSQPGGRYAVPAPAGAVALTALHPTLNQSGTATIANLAKGDVAQVDIVISPVPPAIRSFQPANGAIDQPVGTTVALSFTTALDPASVTSGTLSVELANSDGTGTGLLFGGAVSLSPDKTTVVSGSARPLPPGRKILATFKGGVRGADGTPYAGPLPVTWTFTTSTAFLTGGNIHPEKIHLLIPVNGVAQIVGDSGALPLVTGGTTPWAVWADVDGALACPTVTTYPANTNGGFTASVGCPPTVSVTFASKVYIHIFDPTGTEAATYKLGPFTTPDGLGFVAPPGETTTLTTAEGIQVTAPAAAFDTPTLVTVKKLDPATLGVPIQQGMEVGAYLSVDFDGTANETIRLKIPTTTNAAVGSLAFAGTPVDLPWGRKLKLLDLGRVVAGDSGQKLISNFDADQPQEPAALAPGSRQGLSGRQAQGLATCKYTDPKTGDVSITPCKLLRTIFAEFTARASAAFVVGSTVELAAITGHVEPALIGAQFGVLYNALADSFVYFALAQNWSGGYILPVIQGQKFTIVARDLATGWVLGQHTYDPVTGNTALLKVGEFPDPRPATAPVLIDASPFAVYRFKAPDDGQTTALSIQLVASATNPNVTLTAVGPPFPAGAGVDLYNLTKGTRSPKASPPIVSPQVGAKGGEDLVAVVLPGDLDPDAVSATSPFSFDFDQSIQVAPLAKLADVATLTDCGPGPACSPVKFPVDVQLDRSGTRLNVAPQAALPRGHVFVLTLRPDLMETGRGLEYPSTSPAEFRFSTRPAPSSPNPEIGSTGNTATARDLLKLGNLLMVASASGQLVAVDVSDPRNLAPFATMLGAASQIRALATDGHNRVFYNAEFAGSWAVKAVRMEDVRGSTSGSFNPVAGGIKTAFALGSLSSGLTGSDFLDITGSLPTGTPTDMQVVVQDDTDGPYDLATFLLKFGPLPVPTAPGPDGFYDFSTNVDTSTHAVTWKDTSCSEPAYDKWQRVTVVNETTGQSWSKDVAGGGAKDRIENVRARPGDKLTIRYNLGVTGYIAILGSGITVVDLNRAYDSPAPPVPTQLNKGQCGRHLGKYEGQELELYVDCAHPTTDDEKKNTPPVPGLQNTPALVALPHTSPSGIDVYSVLLHYGAVRAQSGTRPCTPGSTTLCPEPGSLGNPDVTCLKDVSVERPVYRAVALARGVSWLDQGIRSGGGAGFEHRTFAPNKGPFTAKGDLLFFSLGAGGIETYDITASPTLDPIGRFHAPGHTVYRLQADTKALRLYAGGVNENGESIIDVWDLSRANGGPTPSGDYPGSGPAVDPRLLMTFKAPWDGNHIGLDDTGTGLIYTWGTKLTLDGSGNSVSTTGGFALAVADPGFTFSGLYVPPDPTPGVDPPAGSKIQKLTSTFLPLGVPVHVNPVDERDSKKQKQEEQAVTAAFKVHVSLPGSLGATVTAKVQSLRALPERDLLDRDDLGAAVGIPGGPGWPEREVTVTLRRLGTGDTGGGGRFSNAFNLYESDETVLLVADPRARERYQRQSLPDPEAADERTQCRRCTRPSYLVPNDPMVKELLAAGPWVRAYLSGAGAADAIAFFGAHRNDYRPPVGTAAAAAWADEVPSPTQHALAEPALNPAMWSGEAGASVCLTSGEGILEAVDRVEPGRGVDFVFDRTYRSGMLGYGPLGSAGWSSSLYAHLRTLPALPKLDDDGNPIAKEFLALGGLELHDGNGHVFTFWTPCDTSAVNACPDGYVDPPPPVPAFPIKCPDGWEKDSLGSYCVPKGVYVQLQKLDLGEGYHLIGRNHEQIYFDANGRVSEISDRFRRTKSSSPALPENTLELDYDFAGNLAGVTDDQGRRFVFTYGSDPALSDYGLLKNITDFAGRNVKYTFDATNRTLTSVALPQVDFVVPQGGGSFTPSTDTPTIDYSYDPPKGVGGSLSAPLHAEFAKLRLGGMKLPAFVAGGARPERVRFEYDSTTGRVTAVAVPNRDNVNTSGAGLAWTFDATPQGGHPAIAQKVRVTSPWSYGTSYEIDSDGNPTAIEGDGVETLVTPAPKPGFPSPAARGIAFPRTEITYDLSPKDGRISKVLRPDKGETAYQYRSSPGDRISRSVEKKVTTSFGAGETGGAPYGSTETAATTYEDNIARVLSVEMSVSGAASTVEMPVPMEGGLGKVRAGFPDDSISANHDFDEFGRAGQVQTVGTNPVTTINTYDNLDDAPKPQLGPLKKTEQGGGPSTELTFDGGPGDATAKKRWNPTSSKTGDQNTSTFKYDQWDRPVSGTLGVAAVWANVGAAIEKAYDAAGHLVRDRRSQQGLGTVETTYEYDAREELVSVQQNLAARPAAGSSPDRVVTLVQNTFNAASGLLDSSTRDAAGTEPGITTAYAYDQQGRVKAWTEFGGADTGSRREVAYDVMGRLVYRFDGDQTVWWGQYDSMGRLFREALPTGAYVERALDKAGRPLTERVFELAAGSSGTTSSDLSLTTNEYNSYAVTKSTKTIRAGSGPGTRRQTTFEYDGSGRVHKVVTTDPDDPHSPEHSMTTEYEDQKGRLHSQTDALGNTRTYNYGKPGAETSPWPFQVQIDEGTITTFETYRYDAFGRVKELTASDGTFLQKDYDESGNVTAVSTGGLDRRSFQYDSRGLPVVMQRQTGLFAQYGYDAGGRLTQKKIFGDAGRADQTDLGYDGIGRLATRQRPASNLETFHYNTDSTLESWDTRLRNRTGTPLTLAFKYDAANRMLSRRVKNPTDFQGATGPAGLLVADQADLISYADSLSRVDTMGIAAGAADTPDAGSLVKYTGYDMRGLPGTEKVGAWAGDSLQRQYDVFGNTTGMTLPSKFTGLTGLTRYFDELDRLRAVEQTGVISLGAFYEWQGYGRLTRAATRGALGVDQRFTYDGAGSRLGHLGYQLTSLGGSMGSFSLQWDPAASLKNSRTATAGSRLDLTHNLGWSYTHDSGRRLSVAQTDRSTWTYTLGSGDELLGISDTGAATSESLAPAGPEGRITKRGSETFLYDDESRRTQDAFFSYTWDWRGRLLRADGKPANPTVPGERIAYAYDALGRLLTRTHVGALPSGITDDSQRPFIDKRLYVWEGSSLVGETGLNFQDQPIWQKDLIPGPSGLDDASGVNISGRSFSFLKDEQGSVAAVFEDKAPVASRPPLLARVLYNPYGQAHIEAGPELLRIGFDPNKKDLQGQSQGSADGVQGALFVDTTLPIDPATYPGLIKEVFDTGSATWIPAPAGDFVVGVETNDPTHLIVLRLQGWKPSFRYRIRLTKGMKDGFDRSLSLPAAQTELTSSLDIPGDGTAPVLDREFPFGYDSARASGETLNGAFTGGLNLLYTGAWTDPTTGLTYLRNRWYDARNASFLSRDPMEDVDSPNLSAYVGLRPDGATDPMGLLKDLEWDPAERKEIEAAREAARQREIAEAYKNGPVMRSLETNQARGAAYYGIDWITGFGLSERGTTWHPFWGTEAGADFDAFKRGYSKEIFAFEVGMAWRNPGKGLKILGLIGAVGGLQERTREGTPGTSHVVRNEGQLGPEARHVVTELTRMTKEAEELLDAGKGTTNQAASYAKYKDRWFAFFFRGRAIQAEAERLLLGAAATDAILRDVKIRPAIGGLLPDFVYKQRTGEEVILDITSPRSSTYQKILKYAKTGREILVEIYHQGRGLEKK